MDFDNSWSALFRPGLATRFFDPAPPRTIDPDCAVYDGTNAWWMAELSRLTYRRGPDEIGVRFQGPTRDQSLARVGLQEVRFFNLGNTQASLIRPTSGARSYSVLAFRGTAGPSDWLLNLRVAQTGWPAGGKVHRGFEHALAQVWPMVEETLNGVPGPLFYTGHSLGGALAALAYSRRPSRAAYTFGSPRVGDRRFAAGLDPSHLFRVVNHRDLVARIPPAGRGRYQHGGTLCHITPSDGDRFQAAERAAGRRLTPRHSKLPSTPLGPPESFADHSPVNYVAHLERLAAGT